jgi:hypothetical protein
MSKNRPRTAEEALQFFEEMHDNLPRQEQARLACFLGVVKPDDTLDAFAPVDEDGVLRLWELMLCAMEEPEYRTLMRRLKGGEGWLGYWLFPKTWVEDKSRDMLGILQRVMAHDLERQDEVSRMRERLQRHQNGPQKLKKDKEDRHAFIDKYFEAERIAQGVAIGQEDWQKIHAAVKQENGEWLQGKKGSEMDAEDIKKQYRKARPEYHAACKRRSTRQ